MTRPSIYQKACPECAALVAIEAARCDCGYLFEAVANAGDSDEGDEARTEALYHAYLTARLEQAIGALESAQTRLADDPQNLDKAAKVMHALHEVRRLRAEVESRAPRGPEGDEGVPAGGSTEPTEAFRSSQAAKAERVANGSAPPAQEGKGDNVATTPASEPALEPPPKRPGT